MALTRVIECSVNDILHSVDKKTISLFFRIATIASPEPDIDKKNTKHQLTIN